MKKIKRKLYAYVPVRDEAEAKKRAEEEQKRNNLNWLLVRSCGAGDVIFARALLEAGANPSFRDVNGESALQQSIHKGNLNLVELLLRHGANPNQVTAAFPILMEAVFYRQPEIIRALARAGANVNAQ